ncbi:MAG TPA: hypothetical protein VGB82_19545 [Alphaproteobacteria bacterium]
MANRTNTSNTRTTQLLDLLRDIAAALNPVNVWNALNEAVDGVCLMEPARIRSQPRRRR